MKSDIEIIYEDNHLLVVEKPPNILSQGDRTGDPDMLTILKADLVERYKKPGNAFLGLVHRLDRPVGGVMVFAKTSKCASRLSDQIRKREFEKIYLAAVHGEPAEKEGKLLHYLKKDRKANRVFAVDEGTLGAKKALLNYQTMESKGGLSLLKINLITGRPHQIRVQFASMGNPLYGDQRYGPGEGDSREQIALWSHEILCQHPTRRKKMSFTCLPGKRPPWDIFNMG
ncbi:MAG: RNA pseudouridine synthase [Clostridia bacterium]|nr:RNA pseudouridine synthase [Clostridia bacterium]